MAPLCCLPLSIWHRHPQHAAPQEFIRFHNAVEAQVPKGRDFNPIEQVLAKVTHLAADAQARFTDTIDRSGESLGPHPWARRSIPEADIATLEAGSDLALLTMYGIGGIASALMWGARVRRLC